MESYLDNPQSMIILSSPPDAKNFPLFDHRRQLTQAKNKLDEKYEQKIKPLMIYRLCLHLDKICLNNSISTDLYVLFKYIIETVDNTAKDLDF